MFYLPPVTLGEKLMDALLLLLIGLTGPGVFFLYPLFVWRFFEDRKTALWLIVLSIACAIQLIITHLIFPNPVHTVALANLSHHWFSTFGGRFFADVFYYGWLHHAHLGVVLSMIAVVFPFWVGFKLVPLHYRKQAIFLCYIWLIFVLSMFARMGSYAIGLEDLSGDRYVYIPV